MLKGHNLFIFKARTLKIIYYHNSVIIEARTLKFCMIITHYFTLFKNSVKFLVTISCPSPISDDLLCPPLKKNNSKSVYAVLNIFALLKKPLYY